MPASASSAALRPGFLATGVASAVSLAVSTLVVVLAGAGGSAAEVLRAAARVWLVSLGSGLSDGERSYSLPLVGALALAIAVVAVSSAWLVPEPIDDLGTFAATTAGGLAVVAALVSVLSNSGDLHTSIVRAAIGGFIAGGAGGWLAATVRHHQVGRWATNVSPQGRTIIRAAWSGWLVLMGASLLLVLLLLILHLDRAADLWASLDPGWGGGLVLAIGCIATIPTLSLWAASVLIGPGFAFGTDTSVDLTGSQLGAVPGLPVLAALPDPGAFPQWVFLLGLVPAAAGVVAGVKTRTTDDVDWVQRLVLGLGAGAVAGFVAGVLVALSGGSMGAGRMTEVGPPALTPLAVATAVMAMGGALGAMADHYRGRRASEPSEPTPPGGRTRFWRRNQPPSPDRRDH